MNSVGVQPADVVIEPDVTGFGTTQFSRADELAAVGEAAALQAIPNIKNLLQKVDKQLFQQLTKRESSEKLSVENQVLNSDLLVA